MTLNYLLILRFANQKLLWCMRTKRSSSHLRTSNRLCHLNTLQGMSHVDDNPQVSFPSSSSNIWGILCIIFSVAIPQGCDHRAQWSVHVRGRSWLQVITARRCPGHRAVVTGAWCPHRAVLSALVGVWLVVCHTGCQWQPEQAAGEVQREKTPIHHKPWPYPESDHRRLLCLTQQGAGAELAARSSKA